MAEFIERGAFIEAVKDIPMWGSMAAMLADGIPAADVAPVVRGEWIHHDDGVVTCSECGNAESSDSYYCRYCGAIMDGGADNLSGYVVPVRELIALRDELYESDQLTMGGLSRFNALIAKHKSSVL